MDREVVDQSLQKLLSRKVVEDDASHRRLQDIKEEGWDLFLRVVDDGTIIVSAVAVSCCYNSSSQNSTLTNLEH